MARNPRPVAKFLELSGKRLSGDGDVYGVRHARRNFHAARGDGRAGSGEGRGAVRADYVADDAPTAPTIPTETGVAPALRNR